MIQILMIQPMIVRDFLLFIDNRYPDFLSYGKELERNKSLDVLNNVYGE